MTQELLGLHRLPDKMLPPLTLLPEILALNILVIGGFVRNSIRKYTPKRTWRMYSKCHVISHRVTRFTGRARIGWKKSDFPRGKFYAVWVGEGTGIYGERHQRIVAKKSKKGRTPLLRYIYGGEWVSRKSIEGIKPRRMLERGYEDALPDIFLLTTRTTFNFLKVSKHA